MKRITTVLCLLVAVVVRADDFDVAVVGAGTAGIPAALAAARTGARTVLLERSDSIGGTMTRASVEWPGLFHAWGRQIIAGPGWDLVSNACIRSGFKLPNFKRPYGTSHWKHQIRLKGRVYAALAQIALRQAGVEIRTNNEVVGVFRTEFGWRLAGGGRTVEAKQIVDCTGNASVAALCGALRERDEDNCQPGSFAYVIDPGCDLRALDPEKLNAALDVAIAEGKVLATDCLGRPPYLYLDKRKMSNHIPGADNSTIPLAEKANQLGIESMNRMLAFFRAQPGLEKARVVWKAKETGVRETYRIIGDETVTELDYFAGLRYPGAVAYSFYPIDIHTDEGVVPRQLLPGVVPTVPFGCMLPKGTENVLVAGRAVSSDRAANSALRVQATCMAEGQAAGVAAALAARRSMTPREISVEDICEVLRSLGAIVPSKTGR